MGRRSKNDIHNHSGRWVTLRVNLRTAQYEALSRFADEMGMTTSRTTRRILTEFFDVLETDDIGEGEEAKSGASRESRLMD